MACHRPHAEFVGLDGARTQIDLAKDRSGALELSNIEWIHARFEDASRLVSGPFDYIIAHGIFSWVPDATRDALLALCAQTLAEDGLLYLNYNAQPGWTIRGLVRDFLRTETSHGGDLAVRATHAHEAAATLAGWLSDSEHPYVRLLANELEFVRENHSSYVAHEYLATDNRAYWRSEFLTLAAQHGLAHVADADFNYTNGREPEQTRAVPAGLTSDARDLIDLASYRQLHSPIFGRAGHDPRPLTSVEFGNLYLAAQLARNGQSEDGHPMLEHSTGYRVEVKDPATTAAFERLLPLWPNGIPVRDLFADVAAAEPDLRLLHRNGLLELRCVEPVADRSAQRRLHRIEAAHGGYVTTVHHVRIQPSQESN